MLYLFKSNQWVSVCMPNNFGYWQDWISLSNPPIPGTPEMGCLRPFVVTLEKPCCIVLFLVIVCNWPRNHIGSTWNMNSRQFNSAVRKYTCTLWSVSCPERFELDPVVLCIWQNTVANNPKHSHLVMPVFSWKSDFKTHLLWYYNR